MLDSTDKLIISELQQNARLTIKQLSNKLGLSSTPIFERIKKLEKQGVIKGYVALIDAHKVGAELLAITQVKLDIHSKDLIEDFNEKILSFPEVMECFHTTGDADYFLKIRVTDMEEYYQFIMKKLTQLADVSHVNTSFVLHEIKYTTAINLAK